jgi:uncharacterized SAM-binding protein YcdF (DUF218 family)
VSRLVAVLGYSDGTGSGLHPTCAARLERAAEIARPEDAVLFSGWARRGSAAPEAELMAQAWTRPVRKLVVDRGAGTTTGNAIGISRVARMLAAAEVVVVTSSWHGRRAHALVRAALAGSGTRVGLVTTDETPRAATQARELACWSAVPVLAVVAARAR